jgi:hypothetical protein
MRLVIVLTLFFLLLMATFCPAQDLEERVGRERASPRIMIVIDVSGSMLGDKLAEAINSAINIALGPTDDLEVGIIIFNEVATRLIDHTTGKLWFQLPSQPVADAMRHNLFSHSATGMTNPNVALQMAFAAKTQCVVLITDGEFNAGGDPIVSVKAAQKKLKGTGDWLPNFVLMGVKCSPTDEARLKKLAKETGGQLWTPAGKDTTTECAPKTLH